MHLWLERSISFQPTEDQKGKCHCWVVAMRRSCLLVIVGNVIGNAPYIRYLEVGVIRPRCGIFHETKGRAFQPSECYCNSRRANKSSDGFLLDPLPEQHSTLHRWTSSPPKHSPDWAEGQCTLVLLLLFLFFFESSISEHIFERKYNLLRITQGLQKIFMQIKILSLATLSLSDDIGKQQRNG